MDENRCSRCQRLSYHGDHDAELRCEEWPEQAIGQRQLFYGGLAVEMAHDGTRGWWVITTGPRKVLIHVASARDDAFVWIDRNWDHG